MNKLTQKRLKEILEYDISTGIFRRLVPVGGQKAGAVAGVLDNEGYRAIRVDRLKYKAHRLAFLWVTGSFPDGIVDHANLNRDDNSWENLRIASRSENRANALCRKDKEFQVKGVYPRGRKYRAVIAKNGRNRYLGTFLTLDEACLAYERAANDLFGSFARGGCDAG